jgi:hypothetical protein
MDSDDGLDRQCTADAVRDRSFPLWFDPCSLRLSSADTALLNPTWTRVHSNPLCPGSLIFSVSLARFLSNTPLE